MTTNETIKAFEVLTGAVVTEVKFNRYHGEDGTPFRITIVTDRGTFSVEGDCNQYYDSYLRLKKES